jgi:Protein of unknown function (DUF3800)
MANQKVAARLQVGPNCLLFFIDETGHETFADKNYPVFGLGGCAINSSSAAAAIAEPWRAMKAAHFGGEDVPLHANELRNPICGFDELCCTAVRERSVERSAPSPEQMRSNGERLAFFESTEHLGRRCLPRTRVR